MDRDIVLFDMDGTLTEARKPFASFLSSPLWNLARIADIGIVTGSDMDYVQEQMHFPITTHSIRYCLHILPCNGTKWYVPPTTSSENHSLVHEVNMEKEIGKQKYRRLMEILLEEQLLVSDFDIPLTGNFISSRGSMINWCPIGRNANNKQRSYFKKFNKKVKLRNQSFMRLRLKLDSGMFGLLVTVPVVRKVTITKSFRLAGGGLFTQIILNKQKMLLLRWNKK